jgi:hypothetical protein
MIIRKHFNSIREAEKYQSNLYRQYNKVRLIDFPSLKDDGIYAWEFSDSIRKKKLKLAKKIYRASDNSEWLVEKVTIEKKRGEQMFWTGELMGSENQKIGNFKCFRETNQKYVLKQIEDYVDTKRIAGQDK